MADNHLTRYDEKDKYRAVTIWIRTGNMAEVERQTGIKYRTLREWKKKSWWTDKERELQSAVRRPIIKKCSGLLNKGLEAIEDRLTNGDEVVVHSKGEGTIHRVKVSLRDVSKVITDISGLMDRFEKIESNISSEEQGQVQESSVEKLAEQMINVLSKKADNAKEVKPIILASIDKEDNDIQGTPQRVTEEAIKEQLLGNIKEDDREDF